MTLVFTKARRRSPNARADMTASQRRVKQALRRASTAIRDGLREGALTDAIRHLPEHRVLALIDWTPLTALTQPIMDDLHGDLTAAAVQAARDPFAVGKAKTTVTSAFTFDTADPAAAAWARKHATDLISDIQRGGKTLVREVMAAAMRGETTAAGAARAIRNGIGLTSAQAGWVERHYQSVLATQLNSGIAAVQAEALAARSADRYYSRVLSYRAETIARTEILRAANEGRQQAWAQGVREGWIAPDSWKQWQTQFDERTCQECGAMDGAQSPYALEFPDGDPPRHPSCRCTSYLIPNPEQTRAMDDFATMTDAELDAEINRLMNA